jgi:MOSC domain-containing protein YiiM
LIKRNAQDVKHVKKVVQLTLLRWTMTRPSLTQKPALIAGRVSKNALKKPSARGREVKGKVVGVCMSERKTDPKKNVGNGFLRKGWGLSGDSHAGTEKEVSLLAIESIQRLCQETGISARPGCFAENITTEGMDLTSVPIGSKLQIGEARLLVIQIGKDPSQPHTYNYQGYSILPKEGTFCKVIESGEVRVGDSIRTIEGYS